MSEGAGGGGSIWEDGLGRHDEDARVVWEGSATLTDDPQSVRYGDGRGARAVVQAVVAGPVFRNRPHVDVLFSEGLRPIYARLTPEQARAVAALLSDAADLADGEAPAAPGSPRI
jgi:hypothetical protein